MPAVLDNWEAVCRRDLRIPAEPLPWIIFYDEDLAWHLQPERWLLPPHETSTESLRLTGNFAGQYAFMLWQTGNNEFQPAKGSN